MALIVYNEHSMKHKTLRCTFLDCVFNRAPMPLLWRKRLDLSSFRSMSTILAWSILETPATATQYCRPSTFADHSVKKSWRTAANLGGRRTCSHVSLTCSTVLPTKREKWVLYHPRSSLHVYAKKMSSLTTTCSRTPMSS